MTVAKKAKVGEPSEEREIVSGFVSKLLKSETRAIPVRFGCCGYCATVTEARLTDRGKLVMRGDIAEGDGAFAWKGYLPGMHVRRLGDKRLYFTAPDQPEVLVYLN